MVPSRFDSCSWHSRICFRRHSIKSVELYDGYGIRQHEEFTCLPSSFTIWIRIMVQCNELSLWGTYCIYWWIPIVVGFFCNFYSCETRDGACNYVVFYCAQFLIVYYLYISDAHVFWSKNRVSYHFLYIDLLNVPTSFSIAGSLFPKYILRNSYVVLLECKVSCN